jgi:hypothetical protein
MRWAGVFVVALPLLFSVNIAKAITLGELTRRCEALERFWRVHPSPEGQIAILNQIDPVFCFAYIQGITDLRGLIGFPDNPNPTSCYRTQEGKIGGGWMCHAALGFCLPKGALSTQVLAVFLAHARSHVAQWHEEAWPHFLNAMQIAFPCKGQYLD